MTGMLVLEDGTVFRGESVGAEGFALRRGGLHDRDDRLPGGRHRPELLGAARRVHRADGRQLRRRARPLRVAAAARAGGRDARGPRAGLDRLAARARAASRSPGSTRARWSCTCARRARCARSRSPARPRSRRRVAAVKEQPAMAGRALATGVSTREPYVYSDAGTRPDRGRRLRLQALDPRPARLGGRGGDGLPARRRPGRARALRRRAALERARAIPSRWPTRSRRCGRCSAACRSSASASATSCSPWRPGTRPSSCRSATAARTIRCSRSATNRVLVTSQNHGFAVARSDAPEVDARLALRRHGRGARVPGAAGALGAVPSGGAARPARRVAAALPLGRGGGTCRSGVISARSA